MSLHRERIITRKSEVIRRGILYALGKLDKHYFDAMYDDQDYARYMFDKYQMMQKEQ